MSSSLPSKTPEGDEQGRQTKKSAVRQVIQITTNPHPYEELKRLRIKNAQLNEDNYKLCKMLGLVCENRELQTALDDKECKAHYIHVPRRAHSQERGKKDRSPSPQHLHANYLPSDKQFVPSFSLTHFNTLKLFGYDENVHPTFTEYLVNTYGALKSHPQPRIDQLAPYNCPSELRRMAAESMPCSDLDNGSIIIDCLAHLAEQDGKPLFVY